MTAPSFTYSGNVYTAAAAGSVDFALTSTSGNPIAYLEQAHIHVYKSANQGATWTELTRPSQWDFVSSGTVARLATGIASGDWIKIQRITPSTSAYVTFQSSSLLTADQLNDDTLFNTYLNQERYDQGDQSSTVAAAASAAAAAATAASTAATATANSASAAATAATATANAASTAASTALTQSGTALTDSAAAVAASTAAVTTANTASANATSAVATAGTASANATTALNTANTAASNAATALTQSNTAIADSATAVSTATTAASNAATALSQSSTALTNSASAVTTANTASTNSTSAVATANTALSTANAAASAVANAILYDVVANVAAIPATPANSDAVEVVDTTGIESFTPLNGVPGGFVGSSGLSVRMVYTTSGSTWNWVQYFPNDPESRYLKLSGGTLTGQLKADDSTSAAAPAYSFDGDTNTGLAHTGADELALVTGGTARLTIDSTGSVNVPVLAPNIVDAGYVNIYNDSVFYDADSSNYIGFKAPTTVASNVTFTLPNGDGSAGQFLSTNGSGALSWTSVDLSAKLDSATAASTYQTLAGMSSYAPLASPTFTGTITVGSGTTAQRPATAAAGMFRFNTDDDAFEGYDGTQWGAIGGAPTTAPPVVNSVTLAEVNTAGARFTSKDFSVTTTMVDDGTPVSQKGVKAYVEAVLAQYAYTSAITARSVTVPSTAVSPTATNFSGGGSQAPAVAFFTNPVTKEKRFAAIQGNNSGTLKISSDGVVWQTVAPSFLSSPYQPGFNRLSVVGNFLWAYGGSWPAYAPLSNPAGIQVATGTSSYYGCAYNSALDMYYNMKNSEVSVATGAPYGAGGNFVRQTTLSGVYNEVIHCAYGNNRLIFAARQSASPYYPYAWVSTDDGVSFTRNSSPFANANTQPEAVHFFNGYFFVSVNGNLFRSTNGTSWTNVAAFGFQHITDDGTYMYGVAGNLIYRSANSGAAWTAVSTTLASHGLNTVAVGNGAVVAGGAISTTYNTYYVPGITQTLTFTNNSNLAIPNGINVGDMIRMSGGSDGTSARVISINTSAPSLVVGTGTTYTVGSTAVSVQPFGSSTSQRLYLVTDSSGNISDMQSADPGFVNYGPGTSVTLKFPATFPTGNAPDTELPAGTTIRAEIQATNSVASDTELSNIVTPT